MLCSALIRAETDAEHYKTELNPNSQPLGLVCAGRPQIGAVAGGMTSQDACDRFAACSDCSLQ